MNTVETILESAERAKAICHFTDQELALAIREKVSRGVDVFSEQSDLLDEAIYRLCKKACS